MDIMNHKCKVWIKTGDGQWEVEFRLECLIRQSLDGLGLNVVLSMVVTSQICSPSFIQAGMTANWGGDLIQSNCCLSKSMSMWCSAFSSPKLYLYMSSSGSITWKAQDWSWGITSKVVVCSRSNCACAFSRARSKQWRMCRQASADDAFSWLVSNAVHALVFTTLKPLACPSAARPSNVNVTNSAKSRVAWQSLQCFRDVSSYHPAATGLTKDKVRGCVSGEMLKVAKPGRSRGGRRVSKVPRTAPACFCCSNKAISTLPRTVFRSLLHLSPPASSNPCPYNLASISNKNKVTSIEDCRNLVMDLGLWHIRSFKLNYCADRQNFFPLGVLKATLEQLTSNLQSIYIPSPHKATDKGRGSWGDREW